MTRSSTDLPSAAARLAPAISTAGAGFMTHRSRFERGRQLGYQDLDFYIAGRAGVLGEVPAEVAAAGLVFFEYATVRRSSERSAKVQSRAAAATDFAICAEAWAAGRLETDPRWERLAFLSCAHHGELGSGLGVVVATIEVQHADVVMQTGGLDSVKGGMQEAEVVAVGAIDRPANGQAVAFGGDRPLPATLASVGRVRPGALATRRGLVQGAVDGQVVHVETDDAVEGGECFVFELFEDPRCDPLVAP